MGRIVPVAKTPHSIAQHGSGDAILCGRIFIPRTTVSPRKYLLNAGLDLP